MKKLAATAVIVMSPDVAVAPKAAAVMFTVPAAVPVTVAMNLPLASVVPVDGVMVTLPPPVGVRVTAVPETRAPAEFFAVTVSVIGERPSSVRVDPVDARVTVDPTICMGINADMAPEVAVIVAVRLIGLEPAEKVTVALPVLSVVIVAAFRIPVSVVMFIARSGTKALEASMAVTVSVVASELSELTVGDEAAMVRDVAVVVVLVPVDSSLLPPQAARQQNMAKKINSNAGRGNFALINFIILISLFMRNR